MNPLLVAALLAAAPAQPTYVPPPAADAAGEPAVLQRIYQQGSNAIVQVGDDPLLAGTVLSESGLIVCPASAVKALRSVGITFTNGFRATADVIGVDEKLGVALLRTSGLPPMAYVRVNPAPPQVQQAAYAVHFARARTPSVTFARIATINVQRENRIDDRLFTARFGLDPHMRGGPVLGFGGQLIGVLVVDDRSGTGFALTAPALLAFVAAHADAAPPTTLAVGSDPRGAEVLLDGRSVGKTPLTLDRVGAGEHLVTLRSPGLPDAFQRIVALGPARQDLAFTLFPGAPVTIDVPEGADVYIDGLLRGRGTVTLWLPGGRHLVQATLRGRRPFARNIEVVEDRPLSLKAEMQEARATLSVDSAPPGAEVMLDDNRVGSTPIKNLKVTPGTYELTLTARGYHTLKRAVTFPDGADVNLGKVVLEAPHALVRVQAPPGTELRLDGAPRRGVRATGEVVAPGEHQAVFYAPYQYAALVNFRVEDGQVLDLKPHFIQAGSPRSGEVTRTVSTVVEGAAGILSLVSVGFFIAAEADRDSDTHNGVLSSSGHDQVAVGLTTGGVALALYAGSLFLQSLQATPDIGWDTSPNGQPIPPAPAKVPGPSAPRGGLAALQLP